MLRNTTPAAIVFLSNIVALPEQYQIDHYRQAVPHFEACVRLHLSIVSLEKIGIMHGGQAVFVKGDGSDYDRLRLLNNRIKNFDEYVGKAATRNLDEVLLAPMWITNNGLESSTGLLLFSELVSTLEAQAGDAKVFAEEWLKESVEG